MKNGFSKRFLVGLLAVLMVLSNVPMQSLATEWTTNVIRDTYLSSTALQIIKQPRSVAVEEGQTATITLEARGDGLTYKWYYKDIGHDKYYLTNSFKGNTYAVSMNEARNGRWVCCVVTDRYGNSVKSDVVKLSMKKSLRITRQPQSVTVAEGANAAVTVLAEGDGLTYKWYYKDIGHDKYYLTNSFKGNTYKVAMTEARNGRWVCCVITDQYGNSVKTNVVKLTMKKPLKITQQPQSVTVAEGANAAVTVLAEGDGLTYKWYYKDIGHDKYYLTNSFKGNTYKVAMTEARKGRRVCCVVTDQYGNTVKTEAVTLSMRTALSVTQQPQSQKVNDGEVLEITIRAQGDGLTYQWYYKDTAHSKFYLTNSFKSNFYKVQMTDARNGRQVYCVVTDKYGNIVTTDTATMSMKKALKITGQPESQILREGTNVEVHLCAEGEGLTYRWQYSDDFGATWTDGAVTTPIYVVTATADYHGRMVRCVVTDENGNSVTSEAALLVVESLLAISVTEQPRDVMWSVGESAQLRVEVDGIMPHFMWQYSDDGIEWTDLGLTDSSCTLMVTEASFDRMYRCKVWDDYGTTCVTRTVRLLDESKLILVQPQKWTGCESGKAFFEVVVLDSVVSCQWQISVNNGGQWTNSSVVGTNYTTTATAEKNGWLFRCVVRDNEGREQISDAVALTVTDSFYIAAQPSAVSGDIGDTVGFVIQAGGRNLAFKWQRSSDGVNWSTIVENNSRIYQTVTPTTIGRYYRCIVTNGDGRTLTSNTVQLRWTDTGFFTYEGKRFYVKQNGCLASGLETIEGELYCFTAAGTMVTGLQKLESGIYYFTKKGPAASGFTYLPSVCNTLYFGEDHAAAIGWTVINGNTYYFYDTGSMAWGVTQIGDGEYFFDHETGIQTFGMVRVGLNDYMYFREGESRPFAGLKEVDGRLYYFSDKEVNYGVSLGSMQTVDGKTYYFDPITKQAVTGLVTYNGNDYIMGDDYAMVRNGFARNGGNTYLLNADGMMRYGLFDYNGSRYYFDPVTGAAVSGWLDLDGTKLYFDPDTFAARTGLANVGGAKYYFSPNGYLHTGISVIDGVRYYFAPEGEPQTGFVEVNKNVYYVCQDQTVASGLTTVDGLLYYFDAEGVMRTGYRIVDGVRYYFDPNTGAAVTGFVQFSNGNTYYFDGASGTGSGLTKIDGALYCLNENGIVRYGRIDIDGKAYYFDPSSGRAVTGWCPILCGDNVVRTAYFDPQSFCGVTGLQEIDGSLYYFTSSGWVQSGRLTIDGVVYYFSPGSYAAYTGWFENTDGSYIYYDGANGQLMGPGVFKIDGAFYYLTPSGRRQTGLQIVDGARMYFDPLTAQSVDGFVFVEDKTAVNGGKVYYFDALKDARYDLQTIDGNQFYFNSAGVMRYGMYAINGTKCFFDEITGVRKDGPIYVESKGQYYLFDCNSTTGVKTSAAMVGGVLYVAKSDGSLRKGYCGPETSGLGYRVYLDLTTGEQQLGLIDFGGSVPNYFQKNGCLTDVTAVRQALTKALATNGWHTIEGLTYYVKNGAFCKGLQTIGGKTYYFSELTGAMLTGLRRIGSDRFYFSQKSGVMLTGLVTIGGKLFYFDPSTGTEVLGLTQINGNTYYFMENGALTGTVQIGSTRYVFGKNGVGQVITDTKTPAPVQPACSGVWGTLNGVKCFYGMDGKPVTGLRVIDGVLYCFGNDGKMRTGLVEMNGKRYYFTASGAVSGQVRINGSEYYFSTSNFEMLTGMHKIGDVFCYYHEDGTRKSGWITLSTGERLYMKEDGVQNGLAEIGGNTYYFGEDGVMRTGLQLVRADDGRKMTCLFDDDGIMVTGLVYADKSIYYYDQYVGARVTGFASVDGKDYYFDPASGRAVTGLRNIGGVYCYFDPLTAQRQYGLQKVNGKLYYFTEGTTGSGFASGLTVIDGKTYYFSESNGSAFVGYYSLNNVKYYFDPSTGASVSGIYRRSNGDVYSFRAGGGVDTGWVNVGEKSYFFYPTTGLMAEGLASVGDKLYYFDFDKGLLRSTTVTVGGITYQLDQNGYATAVGDSKLAKIINAGIASFGKGYGDDGDQENPDNFTCSQLVTHVFNSIGIELTNRACRQYSALVNGAYDCEIIDDINQAKAGDLIFFTMVTCTHGRKCDFWNEIHHVGVYLGDGKILESVAIDADSYNNGPMIRDITESPSVVVYKLLRINGVNDQ